MDVDAAVVDKGEGEGEGCIVPVVPVQAARRPRMFDFDTGEPEVMIPFAGVRMITGVSRRGVLIPTVCPDDDIMSSVATKSVDAGWEG